MSSGSNVTLSLSKVTIDSVGIIATNQFASETGPVVVFDSDNTEVTRSSNITVSQNNVSVTISGLDGYTEYTAKFYNNDSAMFSDSTVTFTTLGTNKIYGGVSGAGARQITDLYGGSDSGAQRITKLYGPAGEEAITALSGTIRSGGTGNVVRFNGSTFLANVVSSLDSLEIDYLQITTTADPVNIALDAHFTDGTPTQRLYTATSTGAQFFVLSSQYGVGMTNQYDQLVDGVDYIDLTVEHGISYKAKLIHQGFGHLSYN